MWRSAGKLHGFVGERGALGVEKRLGDTGVRGEVEIREQREVWAQEGELFLLGLLHLHDHLLRPRIGCCGHDRRTSSSVVVVAEAGAFAGAGLHENVDAEPFELANPVGRHRHPVLCGLDFLGDADGADHGLIIRFPAPLINR